MKKALLKKRYGIPAALLLVLLLSVSGTAVAWYSFATTSSETTVKEPLSTADEEEFSTTMHPGEENTWTFDIVNSADVAYSIEADLTYSAPPGVSITDFSVGDSDKTSDLKDDDSAEFNIGAKETLSCSMTISAANDAATGDVSVTLELSRNPPK